MATVIVQVIFLGLLFWILNWLKKHVKFRWAKETKVIDILLPVMGWLIFKLTLNAEHISKLPIILLVWLIFALGTLLVFYFLQKQFVLKRYFIFVWRIGDIYFLVMWIICLVIKLLN